MKMNKMLVAAVVAAAGISAANAAVTITYNLPFGGGLSSNLANAAGVVSNGLSYGIIVDGSGNGFLNEYGTANTTFNAVTALTTAAGAATDDVLYMAADLTSDSGQGGLALEGDFTTAGGNGGVTGISFSYTGAVGAGDKYELVWFDLNGSVGGVLTNTAFVVPADSAVESHDSAFVGVDPVRPATGVTFVPEPTSALLGLLGVLGLARRRR